MNILIFLLLAYPSEQRGQYKMLPSSILLYYIYVISVFTPQLLPISSFINPSESYVVYSRHQSTQGLFVLRNYYSKKILFEVFLKQITLHTIFCRATNKTRIVSRAHFCRVLFTVKWSSRQQIGAVNYLHQRGRQWAALLFPCTPGSRQARGCRTNASDQARFVRDWLARYRRILIDILIDQIQMHVVGTQGMVWLCECLKLFAFSTLLRNLTSDFVQNAFDFGEFCESLLLRLIKQILEVPFILKFMFVDVVLR